MRFESFRGADLAELSLAVREALGPDAIVLSNRVIRDGRRSDYEIVAVRAVEVDRLRSRLEPSPIPSREERGGGAYRIALVGPSGSGKTTMAGRLASALGGEEGGGASVICVDPGTEGRGSVVLAAGACEVVSRAADAARAAEKLDSSALIVVDSPSYDRANREWNDLWLDAIEAIEPHEVHLVLPAYIRSDVAMDVRDRYGMAGVTHVLLTKLDDVIGDSGVLDLAFRVNLPSRWASDAQGLDAVVHPAGMRLLSSLGRILEGGR